MLLSNIHILIMSNPRRPIFRDRKNQFPTRDQRLPA